MSDEKKATSSDLLQAVQRAVEAFSKAVITADSTAKIAAKLREDARLAESNERHDAAEVERLRAVLARLISAKIGQNGSCYTEDEANGRRVMIEPELLWPAQ